MRFFSCLSILSIFWILTVIPTTYSETTAITSSSSFTVESDGFSSRGAISLQSGSDIRFGAFDPNYTIAEGHDILLGRSLGATEAKLRVAIKSPDSLTAAEIAGTWRIYEYEVDEAEGNAFATSSGSVNLSSGGTFSYNGSNGSASGSFSINGDRHVIFSSDGELIDWAINASKDFMVTTASETGFKTLRILIRLDSGASTADLAGSWTVGSFGIELVEDPPFVWYDGDTLSATTGGSTSVSGESATWSTTGNGFVTYSDGEANTELGLSQSRSALAYSQTVDNETPETDDDIHEGAILVRYASSPNVSQLAGEWTHLTFELLGGGGGGNDPNTVTTYHPDGTTPARRERFKDGVFHGRPAVEEWDMEGRQTLAEDYDNGSLLRRIEKSHQEAGLSYLIETLYAGDASIREESTYYHGDGVTVSERYLDQLTPEGRLVTEDTFHPNGQPATQSRYIDSKKDGAQRQWRDDGQPIKKELYEIGVLREKTLWYYHTNGRLSSQIYYDYRSGVTKRVSTSWRSDGTRSADQRHLIASNGSSTAHGLQQRYDEGGHLIEEESYLNGIRHGIFRQWYPGGSPFVLSYEAEYFEGKLHGALSQWREDGELLYRQDYYHGIEHGEGVRVQFNTSGRNEYHTFWEYGQVRRIENWYYNTSDTLTEHILKISNAGDLNASATPDYELWETWDDFGFETSYRESRHGKQHGAYKTWENGDPLLEEYYDQGLRHGISKQWENGTLVWKGEYRYGYLHGELAQWNIEEGVRKLASVELYEYDVLHGLSRYYDSDEDLIRESEYKYGFLHGLSKEWDEETGFLTKEEKYADGLLNGLSRYYYNETGILERESYYEFGLLHGETKTYYENGDLHTEGTYDLDLKTGLHTEYREGVVTKTTYLDDILNGPYEQEYTGVRRISGQYDENGLKTGTWIEEYLDGSSKTVTNYLAGYKHGTDERYSDGILSKTDRYSNGTLHGLQETFFPDGQLITSTEYSQGFEIGPRHSYHENGELREFTPLKDGFIDGTVIQYHNDGSLSLEKKYDSGLQHGIATTYSGGKAFIDSTWDRGKLCGTRTWYSYDIETGVLTHTNVQDMGPCDSTLEFQSAQGFRGQVTEDGQAIPGASIRLTMGSTTIASTSSDGSGYYILPTGEASGDTMTVTHPNFESTSQEVTMPADGVYVDRNFALTRLPDPPDPPEEPDPVLTLGDPSIFGEYFIKGVNVPLAFETEATGPSSTLYWKRPTPEGMREIPVGDPNFVFFLNPGFDTDDSGNAGSLFLRTDDGVTSEEVQLPKFNIAKNPIWASALGGWETSHNHDPYSPGEYSLKVRWTPPFSKNLGISKDSVNEDIWTLWQIVPFIGGEDFGFFDTYVDIDAKAYTDGRTSKARFDGNVDFRMGLSIPGVPRSIAGSRRLSGKGNGSLAWGDTLSLRSGTIRITDPQEIKLIFKPTEYLRKFEAFEKAFKLVDFVDRFGKWGPQLSELLNVIEGELKLGQSRNLSLALHDEGRGLEVLFADATSSVRLGFSLDSYMKDTIIPEVEVEGRARVNAFGFSGSLPEVDFDSTIKIKFKVVIKDRFGLNFTYPEETSTSGQPDAKSPFVPASYAGTEPKPLYQPLHKIQSLTLSSTANESAALLVSDAYPFSDPVVAQSGGNAAIGFIAYDPERPEGLSTRFYFSFDSGNGFEAYEPVHAQMRSDFNPQMAFLPDGRLLAVWETSQVDQIPSDVEQRLSGLEIAWAVYDPNSASWSEPALLTDNQTIDHQPVLANSTNGPMLAWHNNESNAPFGSESDPDAIRYVTWTGNGFSSISTFNASLPVLGSIGLGYDGTDATLVWIQDVDGDYSTVSDTEVFWSQFDGNSWNAAQQVTNDNLPDANPSIACIENGQVELVWQKNGRVVQLVDEDTFTYEDVFDSLDSSGSSDYSVQCDSDGNLALVWTEFSDGQDELLFTYFDKANDQWSEPISLTDNPDKERVPAFALNGQGKLLVAYLSEHTDSEQRDLHWLERELGRDLTISSLSIEPTENAPGQFDITASVANQGALPSGSTKISFYQGDPDNGGTYLGELALNLKGGEETEVLYQTGVLAEGTLYARIDPDNTVDELDESNNTLSSDLNPTDLDANYFTWDRDVSDETSLTLKGTVTNNGREAIANVPVTIKDESGTIFETTIASLEPGESAAVETTLATPVGNQHRFTLIVDPDDTLGEPDRSDNEFPLIVTLAQLKDSDGDGMANDWEALYFGTLDRDGNADFDADGLSDRFEFLTQNNPSDPSSRFPFTIEPHSTDPGKVTIRFPTIAGRVYRIQRTSDFINWDNDSFHLGTGETISASADTDGVAGDLNGFRILVGTQ